MPEEEQTEHESEGVAGGKAVNYVFWWGMVLAAVIVVDLVQIGLDFIVIGVVINRLIDVVVGMALAYVYSALGVRMDFKIILALVATFVGEQIPVIDLLPLWTLDVLVTMALDRTQMVLEKVAPKTAERLEKRIAVASQVARVLPGKGGTLGSASKPPPIPVSAGAKPPIIATYTKTPPPIPRAGGTPPPLPRQTPPPIPRSMDIPQPGSIESAQKQGEMISSYRKEAAEASEKSKRYGENLKDTLGQARELGIPDDRAFKLAHERAARDEYLQSDDYKKTARKNLTPQEYQRIADKLGWEGDAAEMSTPGVNPRG